MPSFCLCCVTPACFVQHLLSYVEQFKSEDDTAPVAGHPCDVIIQKLVQADPSQVQASLSNLEHFFQAYHQRRNLPPASRLQDAVSRLANLRTPLSAVQPIPFYLRAPLVLLASISVPCSVSLVHGRWSRQVPPWCPSAS